MLSPFLKKLLFARQFFNINGKLEILGERNIIMEPRIFLLLKKEGYNLGKDSAMVFFKKYSRKLDLVQNNYANLMNLFEIMGFGPFSILKATPNSVTVVIKDSIIAEQYLSEKGKSSSAVCDFLAGFLSGTFSFITNSDANAKETSCSATGNTSCVFEVNWK